MIERATDGDRPFDVILVHSYSRFFRDAFGLELYIRRLAKAGVRLVSITQELGDDPAQIMMRQVIALFDEYQSREIGKHVMRSMNENARQGFYNGSPVPLGYKTEDVEKRGARIKKKLIVDPVEAETVLLVYRLYLEGEANSGPLGIKEIAKRLNAVGHRTRRGGRFGISGIHTILTSKTYVGQATFNRRNSKTGALKAESEHIAVEVPAIVEQVMFDAVRSKLKANNPRVMPPRVVTGPILLTGVAVCATCSGGMTLRTGTSKTGDVHRYYTCSTCARQGKSACKGRSIRMDKCDALVIEHLAERLFKPERLTDLLASVMARRQQKSAEVDARVTALQTQVTDADEKLKRLYRMVEDGLTDLDDILKNRLMSLKIEREKARAALDRARARATTAMSFDPEVVERFGRLMRENITIGEIPFRKAYIRSVIDRIEIDDKVIRIVGDSATLEQVIAGIETSSARVRSFVPKWRTTQNKTANVYIIEISI